MTATLPRAYKGVFPFRLATTSFIYPDDYLPNVRRLAPAVDEVELLFFESGSLPAAASISELAALAAGCRLGYNVHLPTDVSLGHPEAAQRRHAVSALVQAIELCAPLSPSTFTLHVSGDGLAAGRRGGGTWSERVQRGLAQIVGASGGPERISVETLDYPFERLADLVAGLDLRICMDVGHLLQAGQDLEAFFERHSSRIAIIHLHAAAGGRDHLPLDHLEARAAGAVQRILTAYRGIVSIEVFAFDALAASLAWLENRLKF